MFRQPAHDHPHTSKSCEQCPVATSRRVFLRDAAAIAAAAVAAGSLAKPALAFADTVAEIEPATSPTAGAPERTYAMPSVDGVSVDVGNDVILARWENRIYAFSIKCPHRGAQLEWRQSEQRVYCPKHKARFLADGTHFSGRGSRDLDRYTIRRDARGLVVDLAQPIRRDTNPDEWTKAFVSL